MVGAHELPSLGIGYDHPQARSAATTISLDVSQLLAVFSAAGVASTRPWAAGSWVYPPRFPAPSLHHLARVSLVTRESLSDLAGAACTPTDSSSLVDHVVVAR